MQCQLVLNRSKLFHQKIHLILVYFTEFLTDLVHSLLLLQKRIKRTFQCILDRHTALKDCMLVQIACSYILRPFHLSLVRRKFPGNDTHKGRFTLSVCSYKTDVLPF